MRKLKKLRKKQILNLGKLSTLPDSEIDTSDIPPWTHADFSRSVPLSSLYKPRKMQITTRIDADVVEWLKRGKSHYQSRLNSILRIAMIAETRKPSKARPKQAFQPTVGTAAKRAARKLALKPVYRNKKTATKKG